MEEIKTNEIRIDVIVKTIDKKDGSGSFLAYKGFTKRGKLELKFTKECENVPQEKCTIYVLPENVNINTQCRFPVIWVKKIERIEELQFSNKVSEYFDVE